MRRFSTLQRFSAGGYHAYRPLDISENLTSEGSLLGQLSKYQYVKKRLPMTDGLAALVLDLTGGVQRLIVALWVTTHRIALERAADELRLEDFAIAAQTYLSPIAPAVAALRSKDPQRMAKYEDLMPRDNAFWSGLWRPATNA